VAQSAVTEACDGSFALLTKSTSQPRSLFFMFCNSPMKTGFLATLPGSQIPMSAKGDRQQARSGADAEPRAYGCEDASNYH